MIVVFLMFIGYIVDSNIFFIIKLIKRKEYIIEEVYLSVVLIGFMMSIIIFGVFLMLWIILILFVLDNIVVVLIFGLLVDFMNIWIFNVGVLWWYFLRGVEL